MHKFSVVKHLRSIRWQHAWFWGHLNFGSACYHSVQSLLSSRLMSRKVKVKLHKTVILPVVLYGCKTWSLTLREEHRLWVFLNKFLWRISGPKRDEVTADWRKLHNEELHILTHPQILLGRSNQGEWGGRDTWRAWERREKYRVLVGKPEGMASLGRPRHRWDQNCSWGDWPGGVGWIQSAQDRDQWRALANTVMNLRVLEPRS
jgi:hypothetical protein